MIGILPIRLPTLLVNNRYTKTFEVITETQGLPNHGEVDPTPIIAFVWPVFYGLMFADLGHGLLLFGLGMFLRYRGIGNLKTWATLLAASGAAASIAGLGTGEMFGFHIDEITILAPIFEPLGPLSWCSECLRINIRSGNKNTQGFSSHRHHTHIDGIVSKT